MTHILRVRSAVSGSTSRSETEYIPTEQGHSLEAYHGRPCKVYITGKKEWIYFQLTEESLTTFGGYRLQPDSYDVNKFYVTDEKNKWHGVLADGPLSKGRKLYVMGEAAERSEA